MSDYTLAPSDVRWTIRTNHHERPVIEAYELTATEREQFDYLDWNAIDEGTDSASFFRYRGELYDLGEFTTTSPNAWGGAPDLAAAGWHGYRTDSFFSALVVRYADDECDSVIVGLMLS